MQIGCLGDIVFEVSSNAIETLDNMQWSGSAKYATHQRHGTNSLTEFVGIDPDKVSFEIVLSAYLGVDPMAELVKIWNIERNGTPVPLVVGDKGYGKYRWNIISHNIKFKTYSGNGTMTSCTVSVSLQEYLKN